MLNFEDKPDLNEKLGYACKWIFCFMGKLVFHLVAKLQIYIAIFVYMLMKTFEQLEKM